MHILTTNYNGNPNLGLYCFCNESVLLVPVGFPDKLKKQFEDVLGVPGYKVTLAGTSLIGVFAVGNKNGILLPKIIFDHEKKALDASGIKYHIIDSSLTALGNNILCNDHGCIISEEYDDKTAEEIEKALKVPVKKGNVMNLNIVGSLGKVTNTHGLFPHDIKNFETKFIHDNLKVKITTGTINFGSPYISSGIVVNSRGFAVGDNSGGPEIANADEAFGFIE